ncbi:MAG: amidase [Thermomicrobiales bacterium]
MSIDGVGGSFPYPEMEEITIVTLQQAMAAGEMTSAAISERYLARIDAIDRNGPGLNSVIEVNPEALAIAATLDDERAAGSTRGPLHGIPILLKDNIDTADAMQTTAGSLALLDSRPGQDATLAARLRRAGAVILGKTNLSEWANFRSSNSASGWSARGGQCHNPYVLDHSPCGSSSGSAAAVAANLCAAALGTETDGSIVCPSTACGVVGIKPTVGLTSRAGVIPISHSQDTIGPHARTVADATALLGALIGVDPRDPATAASAGKFHTSYTQFLDFDGLRGARIGVPRHRYWGYNPDADRIGEAALDLMRQLGAEIIDPADIPTADALGEEPGEFEVLLYEFKADLNAYLTDRGHPTIATLADVIAFNAANAAAEMPFFGQEIFLQAQERGPLTDRLYRDTLARNRRLSQAEGIDAVMDAYRLDALVALGGPSWPTDAINGEPDIQSISSPAAQAGYPIVSVPAGFAGELPVGINFVGRAWSEPTLIRFAAAFEAAFPARRPPRFLPTWQGGDLTAG